MWGYLPSDGVSLGSITGAAVNGRGADPSLTMAIIPAEVFVMAPLTAEIAPASIKLARAPINAFFTVQFLLRQISLVEQNARAALSVASHGYIMEQGKVVLDGTADELRDNEDVKEFYLGGAGDQRKSFKNLKSFKRRKRWL